MQPHSQEDLYQDKEDENTSSNKMNWQIDSVFTVILGHINAFQFLIKLLLKTANLANL